MINGVLRGLEQHFPNCTRNTELFEKDSNSTELSLNKDSINKEHENLSEESSNNTLVNDYLGISLQIPAGWNVDDNVDKAIILLTPEKERLYIGSRLDESDYIPNTQGVINNSDTLGYIDVIDSIEINTSDFVSHLLHEKRTYRGSSSYALEGEILRKNQTPVSSEYYSNGYIRILTIVTYNTGPDPKQLIDDVKELIESIKFID